jgi:signal transduction histidine kinase
VRLAIIEGSSVADTELSGSQLVALSEFLPLGMVVAEAPSGRILHGNTAAHRILRRNIGPIEHQSGYDRMVWFHPDGRRVAAPEFPLARALAGETVDGITLQAERGDGTLGWVRLNAAPVRDGGRITYAIVTIDDIADERQEHTLLEQTVAIRTTALHQSEVRTWTLFEHSPLDLLVLQVDAAGIVRVDECNTAFCRTTGLHADQLIGRPIAEALGQTGARIASDCLTCLAQGGFECQHSLTFPVGELVVRTYYRPLPDEEAGSRRILLTQIDLTESRRVEGALRQAMRLEAIGQLTGGVAHEFNNLLTAVLGSLDLLSRRVVDERERRWVQTATSAAQRGATLTGQLLAYARKQFLAPAATDVPASLGTMMELIRGSLGSRITLATEFHPATWPAFADPAQLELALLNLLVNARDAMRNGGRVMISTENRPAGHADLPQELEPGDGQQHVVADTGTGMPPDILSRAMEPFFTTKGIGEGSGLGLSQAYGVARQLGGTLRLRSTPGAGTTAHLFLPRAETLANATHRPLLLVDDDADVRSIAGAVLREEGWDVHEAEDGASALAAMGSISFAALLADLSMPGMSGAELAVAARACQPGLPVVFLTGNVDLDMLRTLPGPVLKKPYSVEALLGAVRTAVQGSAPELV